MNYNTLYDALIEKAKHQVLPPGTYTENHHIVPKCLGGSNSKDNIVTLTARQHYIAHKILVKKYDRLTQGKDRTPYFKMLRAFTAMLWAWGCPVENKRAINYCSKLYEQWKKDLSHEISRSNKQRDLNLTDEQRSEISEKISKGLREYFENHSGSFKGKKHGSRTLEKMHQTHVANGHQQGEKNSQHGKHWWINPETGESHSFHDDEVPEGWVRGRHCNFSEEAIKNIKASNQNKDGFEWITNGVENRQIRKGDEIPQGFVHGMKQRTRSHNGVIGKREVTRQQKLPLIREQFEFWLHHSWNEFVEKYHYPYSKVNFVNTCKRVLRDEWHSKHSS